MEDNLTWQSTICTVLEYLRSSEGNDMSDSFMSDLDRIIVLEAMRSISHSRLVDEKLNDIANTIRYYDSEDLDNCLEELIEYVRDYE